jgi:PTH1 family peptidyl-tRNA hydrolase
MQRKWIVCGLGNPGRKYAGTRHNMGFLLLDYLADKYSLSWTKPLGNFQFSEFELDDKHLVFLKPLAYMNLSGRAVDRFSLQNRFEPWELLVLCDDFALPLGRIRLRKRGSDGGHNGLRSIIETLGSQEFPRLRMGVGPVPEEVVPADFVLEPFTEEERPIAEGVVHRAADCFELLIEKGFDEAMGRYNAPLATDETD